MLFVHAHAYVYAEKRDVFQNIYVEYLIRVLIPADSNTVRNAFLYNRVNLNAIAVADKTACVVYVYIYTVYVLWVLEIRTYAKSKLINFVHVCCCVLRITKNTKGCVRF